MDYRSFECTSRVDGTPYRCHFIFLQTAISLRHADTIDVRFLVNGKRITVAIPHVAFVEYARRTNGVLTDNRAASVAADYLKQVLESGGAVEDLTVPVETAVDLALKAGDLPEDMPSRPVTASAG